MRRPRWYVDSCGFGCRLLSRVFRPTSISSGVPGLSLPSTLLSVLVPVLAPVPAPIPILVPVPVLVLVPVHVPVTVFSLPSLGPGLLASCGMAVPDFLLDLPGVADSRALSPPPPRHSRFRSRLRSCPCSRSPPYLLYYPRFRSRSRPRSRLTSLLSSLPPSPSPFQSLLPVPRTWFPLRYSARTQKPGLRTELLGARKRHSLSVDTMSHAE